MSRPPLAVAVAGAVAGGEGGSSPPPRCPPWAKRVRMSFPAPLAGEVTEATPTGRSRKRAGLSFLVSKWVGRFLREPKMGVFSAPVSIYLL